MLKRLFANLRPGNDTSAEALFGWHTIVDVTGGTGEPYMTRIWFGRLRLHVFHTADPGQDPHDHPWGFWTFPLAPYVEEVWLPERQAFTPGRPMPRPKFYKTLQVIKAWRWKRQDANHTHRVLGSFEGYAKPTFADHFNHATGEWMNNPRIGTRKVITVVWRDAPQRRWGFLRRDATGRFCWVPWRMYVYDGGNLAPCAEVEQMKGKSQ